MLTKNFEVSEFRCKGKRCCGHYVKYNMKVVNVCQRVRDILKVPVNINSGYRCEKHNRAVGGVLNSDHVKGSAADISAGVSYARLKNAVYKAIAESGEYGLYVILYPHKNFIHIGWRA